MYGYYIYIYIYKTWIGEIQYKNKEVLFSLIGYFIQLQIDTTKSELIKYVPSSINCIMIM
jgi:hypothetical protein